MLSIRTIASLTLGAAMMFESWGYMMPHQDPTDTLILVNKNNKAPPSGDVGKPDVQPTREAVSENIYMRPEAAAALEDLFEAAAQDGITLYATSGYRSYSTQKAIFERKLERMDEKQANASVAKPGYSEHQTGLAMDIEGENDKRNRTDGSLWRISGGHLDGRALCRIRLHHSLSEGKNEYNRIYL